MELNLKIKRTASGYLISGTIDGKEIEPDVAKTERQAALIARRLVEDALEGA